MIHVKECYCEMHSPNLVFFQFENISRRKFFVMRVIYCSWFFYNRCFVVEFVFFLLAPPHSLLSPAEAKSGRRRGRGERKGGEAQAEDWFSCPANASCPESVQSAQLSSQSQGEESQEKQEDGRCDEEAEGQTQPKGNANQAKAKGVKRGLGDL